MSGNYHVKIMFFCKEMWLGVYECVHILGLSVAAILHTR